jgi:predicted nucleic acid-binding protein
LSLVLDGSVTLSWYFEDERTEASRAVLEETAEHGALVPALWPFEIANGLQMAVRRKRIDAAFREQALANLATMRIEVDPESCTHAWSACVRLSDRHNLTVYDAAYLELAQRRRLRLATLDRHLVHASEAEGVPVIGL